MSRTNLNVPFREKEEAKRLGALWDVEAKVWYVPDGIDPALFCRWKGEPGGKPVSFNVRCNRFFVAEAPQACEACGALSPAATFLLPQGWDRLIDKGEEHEGRWQRIEFEVFVFFIRDLCAAAVEAVNEWTNGFYPATPDEKAPKIWPGYYVNHCGACGKALKETESHRDHVFQPWTWEEAERITLHYYNKPFFARSYVQDHGSARLFHGMEKRDARDVYEVSLCDK